MGMTTVVVLADSPEDTVLPALQPDPLSESQATRLYRSMLADVCETVQRGEADLLVNYPAPDQTADDHPEETLRELLAGELPDPDSARYEVQVGESYAGRVGNTLTHLLDSENVPAAAVVDPATPLFRREHVGKSLMQLRSSDVVLGPTPDSGVYFAGFNAPVDFTAAFEPPAIETLTDRALDADLAVDFLPTLPVVDSPETLRTVASLVRARLAADRLVPPRTAALLEEFDLDAPA